MNFWLCTLMLKINFVSIKYPLTIHSYLDTFSSVIIKNLSKYTHVNLCEFLIPKIHKIYNLIMSE